MKKKKYIIILLLAAVLCVFWAFMPNESTENEFSETVKVALRSVGNNLLLAQQDSTSLVPPIVQLEPLKYQLAFKTRVEISPDSLVALVDYNFNKVKLPKTYRVEVIQCNDQAVAYSFQITEPYAESIIPCRGRELPKSCYWVTVKFLPKEPKVLSSKPMAVMLGSICFIGIGFLMFKKETTTTIKNKVPATSETIKIGAYLFYPQQNKLRFDQEDIPLSKKEKEILLLLSEKPNVLIEREEITKKVWEDHGVVVGRSLDTYLSKLRKILKKDPSIQIKNIHGVGYTLKIEDVN